MSVDYVKARPVCKQIPTATSHHRKPQRQNPLSSVVDAEGGRGSAKSGRQPEKGGSGLSRNLLQLLHFRCIRPPLPLLRSARADGVLPVALRCCPGVYPRLIM